MHTPVVKRTLGEKLGELRNGRDISLRELAKQLDDVTAAHLSDIELGRRYPSEDLLTKLAKFFHISLDELRDHDTRAPVDDIKRRASHDPEFGLALRTLVGKNIKAGEILKWAKQYSEKKEKK